MMTMLTRSMSMPRATRSVATRMRLLPSLNDLYRARRSSCDMPRWMAMDGKLHSVRSLSRYVQRCTDLTKMTTWLNMSASRRSLSLRFFSASVSLM